MTGLLCIKYQFISVAFDTSRAVPNTETKQIQLTVLTTCATETLETVAHKSVDVIKANSVPLTRKRRTLVDI